MNNKQSGQTDLSLNNNLQLNGVEKIKTLSRGHFKMFFLGALFMNEHTNKLAMCMN